MFKKMLEKWRGLGTPVRAAIAYTFSSFLTRGISFITTPIFTRVMVTGQYGLLSKFNSWNSILEVFALLGITSAGVINSGLNDYRDDRKGFVSSMIGLCNVSTVLVFAVVFGIQAISGKSIVLPYGMLAVMLVQFLFQPAQTFWLAHERYEYRYIAATAVTVLSTVVSQVVSILFIKFDVMGSEAMSKLWGAAAGSLAFAIPIYFILIRRGRRYFDRGIWKDTVLFTLPLIPHYLSQHVMAGADRIMLSDSDSAVYSVVSAISLIATVIWQAINGSLIPYAYERMNEGEYEALRKITTSLITGYAVMCVGVSLVAPEVIAILGPEEYAAGIYAVPPIVMTAFLDAMYNLYSTVEFYHKKTKGIAVATIISCLVNVGLNAILIPRFGMIGAAYTTLISNTVLITAHYVFYRKCQPERVYDDRKLLLIGIICFVFCEACYLLYLNRIVRYSVILALCVMVIVFRKAIISAVTGIRNRQEKD